MSENQVGIDIKANDQVSGVLGRIVGQFKQMSGNQAASAILQGVGLSTGVTAFHLLEEGVHKVVETFDDLVKAGEEGQASQARLNASLKANVVGFGASSAAIDGYVESQAKMGFGAVETRDSLAKLVGATHDVTKAMSVQQVAIDLARFKNISLGDATDALTRVEGGSYRILKSLGIQLKSNATSTEALAAVEKVAAGQGEAFANTTAGAFARLQAETENLEEKVGGLIDGPLADLVTVAADDVEAVGHLADAMSRIQGPAGQAADATGKYITVLLPFIPLLGQAQQAVDNINHAYDEQNQQLLDQQAAVDRAMEAYKHAIEVSDEMKQTTSLLNVPIKHITLSADNAASAFDRWQQAMHNAAAEQNRELRGHKETALQIKILKADIHDAQKQIDSFGNQKDWTRKQREEANKLNLQILQDQDQITILQGDLQDTGKISLKNTLDQIRRLGGLTGSTDAAVQNLVDDLWAAAHVNMGVGSGHNKKRAAGGPVVPGERYTVGENGPETLVMSAAGGGFVLPNDGRGGGGGGGGAPVVIALRLDGREVARVVDRHLYYEAARAPQSPYSG